MSVPRHCVTSRSDRRITDLTAALARRSQDGPLVLDLGHPAVRAILALYASLVVGASARLSADQQVLALVHRWFRSLGLHPDASMADLRTRIARTCGPNTRPPRAADDPLEDDDINLDRVAEHVRCAGVACAISSPAPGVAVLQAGPPDTDRAWGLPWRVVALPGRYGDGDIPSTATTLTLTVGPDDLGTTPGISVRAVGALTEPDIAELILGQACRENPAEPLTAQEIRALGFDPIGLEVQ